jgi:hypothetical protein
VNNLPQKGGTEYCKNEAVGTKKQRTQGLSSRRTMLAGSRTLQPQENPNPCIQSNLSLVITIVKLIYSQDIVVQKVAVTLTGDGWQFASARKPCRSRAALSWSIKENRREEEDEQYAHKVFD